MCEIHLGVRILIADVGGLLMTILYQFIQKVLLGFFVGLFFVLFLGGGFVCVVFVCGFWGLMKECTYSILKYTNLYYKANINIEILLERDVAPTHNAMGHQIDPSWAISHSSHWSTTAVTKTMLSCLWDGSCKRYLAANQKE